MTGNVFGWAGGVDRPTGWSTGRPTGRGRSTSGVVLFLVGLLMLTGCQGAAPAGTTGPSSASSPAASAGNGANLLPTAEWRIGPSAGKHGGLAVFLDRSSLTPGQDVGVYVDGAGPVTVRAIRFDDDRGDVVWTGAMTATRQVKATSVLEPIPNAGGLRGTRTMVAPWRRTGTVQTANWPEGHYLVRVDAAGASRFAPLTVRSTNTAGKVIVITSTMTWQAYNRWGGTSLYRGQDGSESTRALAVSYDRPYDNEYGAGQFFTMDAPILAAAQRSGAPLAFATDLDIASDPSLLTGATAIVFGGHSEYWTAPMRQALQSAVDNGTNLAVFGANSGYWRTRLAGPIGPLPGLADHRDGGPRVLVVTKDAALDPLAGRDPGATTAKFRDRPAPVVEDRLFGQRFDCNPVSGNYQVADPTWWGFAGSGASATTVLRDVVGPEIDRVYDTPARPHPTQVIAYARVTCRGAATAASAVYLSRPSGAGVFSAGTLWWPHGLNSGDATTRAVLRSVTSKVIAEFATAGAGKRHPATDTVGGFWLPGHRTVPYGGSS